MMNHRKLRNTPSVLKICSCLILTGWLLLLHASAGESVIRPADSSAAKAPDLPRMKYTIQVAVEDCTGCALCVDVCPARSKSEHRIKAINMVAQPPLRDTELAARRRKWKQPKPRYTRGLMAKYMKLVSTATQGAITDG